MHRKRQEWTFSTVMLWKRPISWNRAEKRELRKLFEAKKSRRGRCSFRSTSKASLSKVQKSFTGKGEGGNVKTEERSNVHVIAFSLRHPVAHTPPPLPALMCCSSLLYPPHQTFELSHTSQRILFLPLPPKSKTRALGDWKFDVALPPSSCRQVFFTR